LFISSHAAINHTKLQKRETLDIWKLWDFFIIRPHTILKTIFGISLGASSANWLVVLNDFLLAKIGTKNIHFP
jgi:hypothetical protein